MSLRMVSHGGALAGVLGGKLPVTACAGSKANG